MAERVGPHLAYWLDAPFEFALWTWHHLQERDRVNRWYARASRLDAAELGSLAHHAPQRLADERERLYAEAAGRQVVAQQPERSAALARRVTRALNRG